MSGLDSTNWIYRMVQALFYGLNNTTQVYSMALYNLRRLECGHAKLLYLICHPCHVHSFDLSRKRHAVFRAASSATEKLYLNSHPTPNGIDITLTGCSLSQIKLYILLPTTVKEPEGGLGSTTPIRVNQTIFHRLIQNGLYRYRGYSVSAHILSGREEKETGKPH